MVRQLVKCHPSRPFVLGKYCFHPLRTPAAATGHPHYWGGVDYTFHFTGKHDLMRFGLAGAAEVGINGKHAGVVFGKPPTLGISDLCTEGENTAPVRLYNSAAYFVTAETVPFGLFSTQLA